MMRTIFFLTNLFVITLCQDDPAFWNDLALKEINRFQKIKDNTNKAKNVILFLGDGMGVSTVTAARILRGQLQNKTGEETVLEFEKFDNSGLMKTYNTDFQVADSGGAATAFLCGVKANFGTVGVDARAKWKNCSTQKGHEVSSIVHWSLASGRSVGIVTTARITHASPAAGYAHSSDRNWEGDSSLNEDAISGGCTDIATQLVKENKDINVLFGGGRRYFLTVNQSDPEYGDKNKEKYQRKDMDLIQYWKDDKQRRGLKHKYVWNNEGFNTITKDNTDFVLGLFEDSHMQYDLDRNRDPKTGEPSLAEMTQKAIEILSKNDKGFFLFVEAARIDHGHHANLAKKALYDTLALEDAVKIGVRMTDTDDTLLVVTADHSLSFNIVGYPTRGNDILGIVQPYDDYESVPGDNILYTTLLYANGPAHDGSPRRNYTLEETRADNFTQETMFYILDSTHSGEDVSVFAQGPMSHLFRSVHEHNYIAHVMAYSSCVGEYKNACGARPEKCPTSASGTVQTFDVHVKKLFAVLFLSCILFIL